MKKIFIFFISFIIISCSSPNKIIQNYLIEEIRNDTIKENILIKEKTTFKEAYRIFQGMTITPKTNEELKINEQLINKYSSDMIENWKKNDFKKVNFKIIREDSIDKYLMDRRKKFNNRIEADLFNIYFTSNTYFYNKNKNLFFNVIKRRPRSRGYIYYYSIKMEKQSGKWIVIDKIPNNDL